VQAVDCARGKHSYILKIVCRIFVRVIDNIETILRFMSIFWCSLTMWHGLAFHIMLIFLPEITVITCFFVLLKNIPVLFTGWSAKGIP